MQRAPAADGGAPRAKSLVDARIVQRLVAEIDDRGGRGVSPALDACGEEPPPHPDSAAPAATTAQHASAPATSLVTRLPGRNGRLSFNLPPRGPKTETFEAPLLPRDLPMQKAAVALIVAAAAERNLRARHMHDPPSLVSTDHVAGHAGLVVGA